MKILIKNIKKSFPKKKVLNDISLELESGKFYGLLGPNGAGKTTLMKIITQQTRATSGSVSWLDDQNDELSKHEISKLLGFVHQQSVMDDFLTVKENLLARGALYGLSNKQILNKIEEYDDDFRITELFNQRYKSLSGGQRRRIDVVKAILHSPKILILDEPTTGIDPELRAELWHAVHSTRKKTGMTIILITHYLEEMKDVDVLITLLNGDIKYMGNLNAFVSKYGVSQTNLFFDYSKQKFFKNEQVNRTGYVSFRKNNLTERIDLINEAYATKNLIDFETKQANLETAYLNLLKEAGTNV